MVDGVSFDPLGTDGVAGVAEGVDGVADGVDGVPSVGVTGN